MAETPDRIGAYRILAPLGSGGMGAVYRAQHVKTGVTVALKTVAGFSEKLMPRIRREIYALSRLRHPGVVSILDQGEQDGRPWYAMELIEGMNLRRYCWHDWQKTPLHSAPVSREHLFRVLTQVRRLCEPLAYVHGEGIVHRDLKPDNVVVRENGVPVLVDFGLSSPFSANRREALMVEPGLSGTVLYMAPELLRGEPVDARADLYALGCIFYELLAGFPPFAGKTMMDTITAHLQSDPKSLTDLIPEFPFELNHLIFALLARDRRQRIGYADHVAGELIGLGADEKQVYLHHPGRSYLYRSQMIGRSMELARLMNALDKLEDGHGGLFLVGGESGVGKSRLMLEFAQQAVNREVLVLQGESADSGGQPLHIFRNSFQWIADFCRANGKLETDRLIGDRGAVLSQYFPEMQNLPGHESYPEISPLPGPETLIRLQNYVVQTLFALCEQQKVLLILEDLQWADELSIQVLLHLLKQVRLHDPRLLIAGTYRSEEVGEDLQLLIPQTDHFLLSRLDSPAITAIVSDMLALEDPPQELVAALEEHSEGNPFFVAEYLQTAVEQRLLHRDSACVWKVSRRGRAAKDLPLSESLRSLLTRRFAGLPAKSLRLLHALCVLGRETSAELSSRVSSLARPDLLEALSDLLRRQILEEAPGGNLRFVHDKIREAGYEQMPEARRKELHRKTAESIEKIAGETAGEEYEAILGYHWSRCGNLKRARQSFLAAARQSVLHFSLRDAERQYRDYLAIAEESDPETALVRSEFARDVLTPRGANRLAIEEHTKAMARAQSLSDVLLESRALLGIANAQLHLGGFDEAESAATKAMELFRSLNQNELVGESLRLQAIAQWHRGNLEAARSLYEQALKIYRSAGNRVEQAKTLSNLATICWSQGNNSESRALSQEAILLHRQLGQRRNEAITMNNLAVTFHHGGPLENARLLHQEALAIHRKIGDRRTEAISLSNLGYVSYRSGEIEAAESYLREGLAIQREIEDRLSEAQTRCMLAHLLRECRGSMEEATQMICVAEAIARELNARIDLAACLCELGHLALADGVSARQFLKEARKLALDARIGLDSEQGRAIEALGRAVMAQEAGMPLFRGVRLEDIPAAVREWLSPQSHKEH